MALPKYLTEDDIQYILNNLDKSASQLERELEKPRKRISKVLRQHKEQPYTTRHPFFTLSEIAVILEMKDHYSFEHIAKTIGKGSSTSVGRAIKKHAPEYKKRLPGTWHPDKEKLFIDNYNDYSNAELYNLFGFSISTISYHARRLGLDNSKRNRTSIEYYVANYLDSENIVYEEQYNFDKYKYDFYLKDLNLLIEVQGDYWHANPDVYRNTELTEVQKSNVQRDVDKKKVALENSYKIVYLWEKDIKENILNLSSYFKKNIKIN